MRVLLASKMCPLGWFIFIVFLLVACYVGFGRSQPNRSHAENANVAKGGNGGNTELADQKSDARVHDDVRISDLPTPYMPAEDVAELRRPWPEGTNPFSVDIEFVAN